MFRMANYQLSILNCQLASGSCGRLGGGHSQQEALHAEWGASVLVIVAFIIHMFRMASLPLVGG